MSKLVNTVREELGSFHLRLALAQWLLSPLPFYVGNRLRAQALRLAGFRIGPGTIFFGMPTIVGTEKLNHKLILGRNVLVSIGCYFDLADSIIVGDRASIGPETMFITGTHQMGGQENRLGTLISKPIQIGAGAWLGARCLILPGVTIGEGAVVAAGAVVTKNVAPNVIVAGVPAGVLRQLDGRVREEIRRELPEGLYGKA